MILTEIKKSQGLSVSELCERIGLSYMGVKQHCVALEKEGYLDTWRRPKGMGRPEKAYRLTGVAQEFFPTEYGTFTTQVLDSINQVYGPNAAEKILHNIYQNETKKLSERLEKLTALEEKARELANLRDQDGYMSEYYYDRDSGYHQIVEYNSPILLCLDNYPILRELEKEMFTDLLSTSIERDEERVSGLYKCIFTVQPSS
ncbi:MAG: winged helix-turn-helix transcriptional regulator [Verrucomicrobiota bacterium]